MTMTTTVDCVMLALDPNLDGVTIMQYQSGVLPGQLVVIHHNLPLQVIALWHQFTALLKAANQQNILVSLCGVLNQALNAIPPPNVLNGQPAEKLAVMVIDGSVGLGADPLQVSDEFIRYGITLAIVATCTSFYARWNFYAELAANTGGDYMLLEDAPRVLSRALLRTVNGYDTLRQAFLASRTDNPDNDGCC